MGMSERDPRRDPKVGDVLVNKRGVEREIVGILFTGCARIIEYVGPNVFSPQIKLAGWRSWAKDAEVISRAE